MEDTYIRWILWAVIIIGGVAVFWYFGRKEG